MYKVCVGAQTFPSFIDYLFFLLRIRGTQMWGHVAHFASLRGFLKRLCLQ